MNKAQVLKTLRTLHGWLGVLLLPWIIVIGATGFYLNHARMVLDWIEPPAFSESRLATWEGAAPVDEAQAAAIAARYLTEAPLPAPEQTEYHDFAAFKFAQGRDSVIVARATGHYYVKTAFTRLTFAPDGTQVHKKVYWGTLFKRIHTHGWFDNRFASWLADLTAISMMLFGLTGIILFWMPRARRVKRALGLERRPTA